MFVNDKGDKSDLGSIFDPDEHTLDNPRQARKSKDRHSQKFSQNIEDSEFEEKMKNFIIPDNQRKGARKSYEKNLLKSQESIENLISGQSSQGAVI